MKRFASLLLICFSMILLFNSCTRDEPSFDESLLIGKWQSGTLYYRYMNDRTGLTWDTADDVTEAEGQKFTWTLVKSELTNTHIMEVGGDVPKVYTVTTLNATTLAYKDSFGKSYTFTKK